MTTNTITSNIAVTLAPGYYIKAGVTDLVVGLNINVSGDPAIEAGTVSSAALQILNEGVVNSYAGFYGIILKNGGTVTNGLGATREGYYIYGADAGILSYGRATVINLSGIGASDGGGNFGAIGDSAGVDLRDGGSVTNGSAANETAYIIGGRRGVFVTGGVGQVVNFGTISTFGHGGIHPIFNLAYRSGVYLGEGGTITNGTAVDQSALISGVDGVVAMGAAATLVNLGHVYGQAYQTTSYTSFGVDFALGGSVTNGSTADKAARISGGIYGVALGGAGVVTNYGAIVGGSEVSGAGVGVVFHAAGELVNGSNGDATASVSGEFGVKATSAAATIVNFGAITGAGGDGVLLGAGGQVQNGSTDDGLAAIEGDDGVQSVGSAIIVNYGAILGFAQYGVHIQGGGAVSNGTASDTAAVIQGYNGVGLSAAGNVFNDGVIRGEAGFGVHLQAGGYLSNGSAFIRSAQILAYNAVRLDNGGSVANFGAIHGSEGASTSTGGTGVYAHAAVVTNGSASDHAALIEGNAGVELASGSTFDNFGTVQGGGVGAVLLGDASCELIVESGSRFISGLGQPAAVGDRGRLLLKTGDGLIRLLSDADVAVSKSMTLATLSNFGSVTIGSAAQFTLIGAGFVPDLTTLDVAGSLSVGATLELVGDGVPAESGQLTVSGTLGGAGTLEITNGGQAMFDAGTALSVAHVTMTDATSAATVAADVDVAYAGVWKQTAGTLTAGTGVFGAGSITFTGVGDSFAGTLAGQIAVTAGSATLDATKIHGYLTIAGTGTVTLEGAVSLGASDALSADGGKVIVSAAGASLAGGTVALGPTCDIFGASAAATLTNVNCIIDGAGQLGGGKMKIINRAAGEIIAGGETTALVIDTGAQTVVNAGKIESFSVGGMVIKSAVQNGGSLLVQGGDMTVDGAVSGLGSVQVNGATAKFGSTFHQNVAFFTPLFGTLSGVLELADSHAYSGVISGFSTTGATSLDLDDIAFTSGKTKATYAGTSTSGTLTVTDGTHTARIKFSGDYTGATWTLSSDGHGGTTVIDPKAAAVRFAAGAAALAPAAAATSAPADDAWRASPPRLAEPRAEIA